MGEKAKFNPEKCFLDDLVTDVKLVVNAKVGYHHQGRDFQTGELRLFNSYQLVGRFTDQNGRSTPVYEIIYKSPRE